MKKNKRKIVISFSLSNEDLDKLEVVSCREENRYNKSLTVRNLINDAYAKITKKEEDMSK